MHPALSCLNQWRMHEDTDAEFILALSITDLHCNAIWLKVFTLNLLS